MKIGLMGFGHLGKAVAQGLMHVEGISCDDIYVSAHSEETLRVAQEQFGLQACASNAELQRIADVVILLLPPDVFRREQFTAIGAGKMVVSMMAGVKLTELRSKLGGDPVRAMPNLGVATNRGLICHTPMTEQRVIDLLNGLGETFCVSEDEVERFMAVASCGIGFAAHLLHNFAWASESMGFAKDIAVRMTRNVFSYALGAENFLALADAVATKGGATEAGIASLVADDVPGAMGRAVEAAYQKMK